LLAAPVADLLERPGGQFDPGTAGGFNTGPGFESKGLPNNPWQFLLLIEGTLVWTSGLASRQHGVESGYRFAVSPFTVRHRAAGYGSAGANDDSAQRVRAEVWMPVWRRTASLAEVTCFIGEGRVDVRGPTGAAQRAVDSIDFVDALASLGVDRGVESFVRYAFMKRRGDSYIALPAGVTAVSYREDADLLRELDRNLDELDRFLARFPSEQGPPAQLAGLRRRIDNARFEAAARGGPDAIRRLVRAVGALEQVLARRDPGKEPQLRRPLGGLNPQWVAACGQVLEVRLAAALASIAAANGGVAPLRAYLAPLSPRDPGQYAPAARALAWSGRTVADRLANVLQRRLLDARTSGYDSPPIWGSYRISLDDVASFLSPGIADEGLLQDLIFGLTWVRPDTAPAFPVEYATTTPLPRSYALLKLLYLPGGIPRAIGPLHISPDPAIVPLLRAGRVADAVERASAQLRARGLFARRVLPDAPTSPETGQRLAAALLLPIANPISLKQAALLNDDSEETTNA
jgi:CRISPR-associated protein Csx17